MASLQVNFNDLPVEEAERSMRLFAEKVMPRSNNECDVRRRILARILQCLEHGIERQKDRAVARRRIFGGHQRA